MQKTIKFALLFVAILMTNNFANASITGKVLKCGIAIVATGGATTVIRRIRCQLESKEFTSPFEKTIEGIREDAPVIMKDLRFVWERAKKRIERAQEEFNKTSIEKEIESDDKS